MIFHHFSFTKVCPLSLPLMLFLFSIGAGFSQDSASALHNMESQYSNEGFANTFYSKFNESPLYAYSMPGHSGMNFQPAMNDNETDFAKIGLQKSFWSGLQFTYKNSDPGGVFGFTGLSLSSEFNGIISSNPAALEEAEKSFLYNGIALGGSIAMLWITTQYLLDTIDQADEVSGGNMYAETPTFNLIGFVIAAVVTGVGSYFGREQIRKGVDIYNKNEITDTPAVSVVSISPDKSKTPIEATIPPPEKDIQTDESNVIEYRDTPYIDGEFSTTEFGLNTAFKYYLRNKRVSPYLGAGLGFASRSVEFFDPILWSSNITGPVYKTTYSE